MTPPAVPEAATKSSTVLKSMLINFTVDRFYRCRPTAPFDQFAIRFEMMAEQTKGGQEAAERAHAPPEYAISELLRGATMLVAKGFLKGFHGNRIGSAKGFGFTSHPG
jgi:hypothetical protein